MKSPLHQIALTVLALSACAANASTLDVTGWQLGESVVIAGRGSVGTAELGDSLDGSRGFSYGIDLAQSIGPGPSDEWSILAPDSDALIGAAWLIDTFHPEIYALVEGGVARATAVAALQIAVWEVMAEELGDYSLFSGAFALEEGGASAGALTLANDFLRALGQADLAGFSTNTVWVFHPDQQDQLFYGYAHPIPIPEPGAVGLCGVASLLAASAICKTPGSADR